MYGALRRDAAQRNSDRRRRTKNGTLRLVVFDFSTSGTSHRSQRIPPFKTGPFACALCTSMRNVSRPGATPPVKVQRVGCFTINVIAHGSSVRRCSHFGPVCSAVSSTGPRAARARLPLLISRQAPATWSHQAVANVNAHAIPCEVPWGTPRSTNRLRPHAVTGRALPPDYQSGPLLLYTPCARYDRLQTTQERSISCTYRPRAASLAATSHAVHAPRDVAE